MPKTTLLPDTRRMSVTLTRQQLKSLKKFAIDFDQEEKDVPSIALDALLQKYDQMTSEEREGGLSVFFPKARVQDGAE